jgi:hypothetical protein
MANLSDFFPPNAGVTIDATPTDGSNNPVASNGVFDALALKSNFVGTYADLTALQAAKPAASNAGAFALVGTAQYGSNGSAWTELLGVPVLTTAGAGERTAAPAFVRSIGASNAVAAAIEALSAAMPKNGRVINPLVTEQGVIELDARSYVLEKPIDINLTGASDSRYGLTIRGQGMSSTKLVVQNTAAPATFRDTFGDGIWRAIRIRGSDSSKFGHIKLQGFGVMGYATQSGDGSTALADPCRWVDLYYLIESSVEDVLVYSRDMNPLSMNQYNYSIENCYYFDGRNMRSYGHKRISGGIAFNGGSVGRRFGVGFRLKGNNALTLTAPVVTGANLSFHLIDELGASIFGGASELMNKVALFDGSSSGSVISSHRCEFHVTDSQEAFENISEMYLARFTEKTSFNRAEFSSGAAASPSIYEKKDYSLTQSNEFLVAGVPRRKTFPNVLSSPTWVNSGGVSSTASTDVPEWAGVSASREITYTGAYNQVHHTQLEVDPTRGSMTVRAWVKHVSGLGMVIPEISTQPGTGNRIFNGLVYDSLRRVQSTTIPLASSGHTYSAGVLTLISSRPHGLQHGVRLQLGAGTGTLPTGTDVYVSAVQSNYSFSLVASLGGTLADPGTITNPGAIAVPSDMIGMQFVPSTFGEWREFIASVPIRLDCTALASNGSNQAVVTLSSGTQLGLVTGVLIRLRDFSDQRLNVDYTIQSGDVSGANITLTGLGALTGLVIASTGQSTTTSIFGNVGLRRVWLAYHCRTTNTGQSMVWRFAGEEVFPGAHYQ